MFDNIVKAVTIIVGVFIAIIGYLAKDKIGKIDEAQTALWHAASKNSDTLTQVSKDLAVIGTSFQAHIKDDDKFDADTQKVLADHEYRIRARESLMNLPPQPAQPGFRPH